MEKYRGPKDQYRRIERRYITGLLVGIVIIGVGVIANVFNVALSESTIQVPGIDPGAGPDTIEAPFDANASVGIIALVVGGVINFYSINKYRGDYAEIADKEPRPAGMLVGIGLLITLLALGASGYFIFVLAS
ncbi:MAG: hypothetical protein ACE1ZC_03535 [Nitrososphaerales archaeon]|nr:hypothetical protein [Nitrososphaerota archaeon]